MLLRRSSPLKGEEPSAAKVGGVQPAAYGSCSAAVEKPSPKRWARVLSSAIKWFRCHIFNPILKVGLKLKSFFSIIGLNNIVFIIIFTFSLIFILYPSCLIIAVLFNPDTSTTHQLEYNDSYPQL
jgi:membrane protein insertase Oxa1/YidC/SpoIIIJ